MLRKPLIALAISITVSLTIIAVFYFFFWGGKKTYYYTRVDNTKMTETVSDGGVVNFSGSLPYTYTLDAYDEKGSKKEISFGTSRELKDDAILILTYAPVRGVIEWREACDDEISENVREHFRIE